MFVFNLASVVLIALSSRRGSAFCCALRGDAVDGQSATQLSEMGDRRLMLGDMDSVAAGGESSAKCPILSAFNSQTAGKWHVLGNPLWRMEMDLLQMVTRKHISKKQDKWWLIASGWSLADRLERVGALFEISDKYDIKVSAFDGRMIVCVGGCAASDHATTFGWVDI